MRRFQPYSAIVNALKESKKLDLIDTQNGEAVKRKTPLGTTEKTDIKVFEDRAMPRSIYAKGFGPEGEKTQFDIEAFFEPYGPTNAIRLRRADDKNFKGSVFVEFESEELQKKFLELDPKPKWNDTELKIMSKRQYCDDKVKDIEAGRIKPNEKRGRGGHRGGKDDRDWRDRRDEDRKNGRGGGRGGRGRGRGGRGRGGDRREGGDTRRSSDSTSKPKEIQRDER